MNGATLAAYRDVQTATADPARMLLLLFDAAGRFLTQALRALERGDTGTYTYDVARANAIVLELVSTLDHDKGGEVAANLARLYDFMVRQLGASLATPSAANVRHVLELVRTIRSGFAEAVERARA